MLNSIPLFVLLGAIPLLAGGAMAVWPREVTSPSPDPDGKPIPAAATNIRWAQLAGIALVVLGVFLVVWGFLGTNGTNDPVLF
jgi:hypothetical protein